MLRLVAFDDTNESWIIGRDSVLPDGSPMRAVDVPIIAIGE